MEFIFLIFSCLFTSLGALFNTTMSNPTNELPVLKILKIKVQTLETCLEQQTTQIIWKNERNGNSFNNKLAQQSIVFYSLLREKIITRIMKRELNYDYMGGEGGE